MSFSVLLPIFPLICRDLRSRCIALLFLLSLLLSVPFTKASVLAEFLFALAIVLG